MLFNSLEFTIFLPIVFLLYWFVGGRNVKIQNISLLVASYVFYGWWDWRFLTLIFLSSIIDYSVANFIKKTSDDTKRKRGLYVSLISNLGLLAFFKYFNFFIDSFNDAFTFFGSPITLTGIEIILPVGISFYTFQTLSYTIDVYRKRLDATNDIISFLAFVSFFPQLVAGPIERAKNLLPQFYKKRSFSYVNSVDGLKQVVWGAFKKLVIADNCALLVNQVFDNSGDYNGSTLLVACVLFAFQIYGDFSGYSDMAIGIAKLFGINLMKNFSYPYFSRNIAEFWRRWHISLSTWFRDYLYIPLGGSRGSLVQQVRNVFLVFLISGLWHGANWTFVVWGVFHASMFLPLLLINQNRKYLNDVAEGQFLPSFKELIQILTTFILVSLAWVFFRSATISQSVEILNSIFSSSLFTKPEISLRYITVGLLIFLFFEWLGRRDNYAIERLMSNKSNIIKWGFYYLLVMSIIIFRGEVLEFIYFQF